MNRFKEYQFLLLLTLIVSCATPPPPKKEKLKDPVPENKTKVTVTNTAEEKKELAFLESIEDGRNLPSSGNWKEEQYASFTDQTFLAYAPAKERIDFKNLDYPLLNAAIYYATSRERRKLGMKPFRYSSLCEQAAFGHAQDMVNLDFYSHTSKVSGKETIKERLELVGIVDSLAAENINTSFGIDYKPGTPVYTPEQHPEKKFSYQKNGPAIPNHTYLSLANSLIESWMNSPSHRRNVLNPDFSYAGAGAYQYQDVKFHNIEKVKAVVVFSSKP